MLRGCARATRFPARLSQWLCPRTRTTDPQKVRANSSLCLHRVLPAPRVNSQRPQKVQARPLKSRLSPLLRRQVQHQHRRSPLPPEVHQRPRTPLHPRRVEPACGGSFCCQSCSLSQCLACSSGPTPRTTKSSVWIWQGCSTPSPVTPPTISSLDPTRVRPLTPKAQVE